jgi:hypothetical protein
MQITKTLIDYWDPAPSPGIFRFDSPKVNEKRRYNIDTTLSHLLCIEF